MEELVEALFPGAAGVSVAGTEGVASSLADLPLKTAREVFGRRVDLFGLDTLGVDEGVELLEILAALAWLFEDRAPETVTVHDAAGVELGQLPAVAELSGLLEPPALPQERLLRERHYLALEWSFASRAKVPRRAWPWLGREPFALYPMGMQRTLYGSYLLYVSAYRDIAKSCGPFPLTWRQDEKKARKALAEAKFPPRRTDTDPTWAGGRAETAEWVCDRVLDGIWPGAFRARPDGRLDVVLAWDDCRMQANSNLHLPNVRATFRREPSRLHLDEIEVQYPNEDGRVVRPDEGPRWRRALRILRGELVLQGELEAHLARGHLLAEHVLVALNVAKLGQEHPVRLLVEPVVEGADVINRAGDLLILGKRGVIAQATPLHPSGILDRLRRDLGALDWATFEPPEPVVLGHRYALAARAVWEELGSWVEEHLPDGSIELDSVRELSDVLVASSVDYQPYHGVADPEAWAFPPPGSTGPREGRAVSPIRTPSDLRRWVRYVVFHATFGHTWTNNTQWDDGGDPTFAALALARRLDDPDFDREATPTAVQQGYQKLVAYALTRLDVGYFYFDDLIPRVHQDLKNRLMALGPPFVDRGSTEPERRLHKDRLRSRVNA